MPARRSCDTAPSAPTVNRRQPSSTYVICSCTCACCGTTHPRWSSTCASMMRSPVMRRRLMSGLTCSLGTSLQRNNDAVDAAGVVMGCGVQGLLKLTHACHVDDGGSMDPAEPVRIEPSGEGAQPSRAGGVTSVRRGRAHSSGSGSLSAAQTVCSFRPNPLISEPMRMSSVSVRAATALVACLVAPALGAQHQLALPASEADRIDPSLRAALDTAKTVNVMILGRTQLLAPLGGLDSCAVRYARADRRGRRRRVVADLKRIAATEQPAIMRVLGELPSTRLWIVNAVAASVRPDELRRLASMDEVRFIYPSPPPPRSGT